jgi:hypothetical protein
MSTDSVPLLVQNYACFHQISNHYRSATKSRTISTRARPNCDSFATRSLEARFHWNVGTIRRSHRFVDCGTRPNPMHVAFRKSDEGPERAHAWLMIRSLVPKTYVDGTSGHASNGVTS